MEDSDEEEEKSALPDPPPMPERDSLGRLRKHYLFEIPKGPKKGSWKLIRDEQYRTANKGRVFPPARRPHRALHCAA